MSDHMIWLILLPLVWGTFAFISGPGKGAWISITGLFLQFVLTVIIAAGLSKTGPLTHTVGGWGQPLGIDLALDGLSAAMLLLVHIIALPVAIYARSYFSSDSAESRYYWPVTGFLFAGINALLLSADLFNIYVTLELVGLSAVILVATGGGEKQISAALRYLFATLIGSGMYLLGIALIYGTYGTVSIASLDLLIFPGAPDIIWIAVSLMLIGLMLKTALFPFHFWLPPAHGSASSPVSALLSALVVKASFYLILRIWLGPFHSLLVSVPAVSYLPMLLGSGAILWGSYKAIRVKRIKMLIAYSTVAQLGYLFLIFFLLSSKTALQAGIMQAFAHGLAKASMFAAAGVLIKSSGQDTVAGITGTAERIPITLFSLMLAGVTLMGLPPSSGFLAKWMLIEAALEQGHWFIAVIVLSGGLLAAVYVFRLIRQAFVHTHVIPKKTLPVPRTLEWAAFSLAAMSVLLGLRGVELMNLISGFLGNQSGNQL
jgi:formate hydrogenlyase subunit 3/multisubunit Na+/H+ antiporter MnhD subunit